MHQIPVTEQGRKRLQQELREIEADIPNVQEAVAEAREKGDLKENAEYHSAREKHAMLLARRDELRTKLAHSVVVNSDQIDKSYVAFGACVELEDLSDGSLEDWFLVGEGEDDPLENKILTTSPMGQALISHQVGETITVPAPIGDLNFRITKISYPE